MVPITIKASLKILPKFLVCHFDKSVKIGQAFLFGVTVIQCKLTGLLFVQVYLQMFGYGVQNRSSNYGEKNSKF